MNLPDVQPAAEPEYFDLEEADMSEQEFAASLETAEERPKFVIDKPSAAEGSRRASEANLNPGAQGLEEDRTDGGMQILENVVSPAPDEVGTSAAPDPTPSDTALSSSSPEASEENWRKLVSAKVRKYKSRKPQLERYPSLGLQFDSAPYVPISADSRREPYAKTPEAPVVTPSNRPNPLVETASILPAGEPQPEPRIVLEATARVLEFPRPAAIPSDELADPVIDRLRIVEAPELLPPPAMGGILIDPPLEPEPERRPGFDMPLQSAPLGRKVVAGVLDGALVALAMALFAYIFLRITAASDGLPWRTEFGFSVAVLGILWAGYQYGFLVFCRTTPGLFLTKLRVRRFDGTPAPRSLMRWRVVSSLLSWVSLGLGYAWCFLDEDQLTWHDRITRTHLAPKSEA
jgi:uncharacterized RDD family membrane protein YckC